MEVGKRIIQLRKDKGITTNKLANIAGVSQSYLREIELGNKNPTVEMLSYICDALGVTLSDFFKEQESDIEPVLKKALRDFPADKQMKLAEFICAIK